MIRKVDYEQNILQIILKIRQFNEKPIENRIKDRKNSTIYGSVDRNSENGLK